MTAYYACHGQIQVGVTEEQLTKLAGMNGVRPTWLEDKIKFSTYSILCSGMPYAEFRKQLRKCGVK